MATTAASPQTDNVHKDDELIAGIRFVDYVDESQLDHVMSLVGRDLSEPYSSELKDFGRIKLPHNYVASYTPPRFRASTKHGRLSRFLQTRRYSSFGLSIPFSSLLISFAISYLLFHYSLYLSIFFVPISSALHSGSER